MVLIHRKIVGFANIPSRLHELAMIVHKALFRRSVTADPTLLSLSRIHLVNHRISKQLRYCNK